MNEPAGIDASTAWDMIRSAPAPAPRSAPALTLTARGGARLDVAADGSWTSEGPVSAEAGEILALYLPLCVRGGRYIFAQLGQSLDGRIATESGASRYITGPEDLLHLHRLRALADVVVVGAGTALADDPALTVRRTKGANPVRAIIDSSGRVPDGLEAFHDGAAETLLLHARDQPRAAPGNAECVGVARVDDGLAPAAIIDALVARGLQRILIEGGGITVSRFLAAGLLDRLHVTVTPMIIGSGRAAFTLPAIDSLDHALRPAWRRFEMGEDMLFDLDLRADC